MLVSGIWLYLAYDDWPFWSTNSAVALIQLAYLVCVYDRYIVTNRTKMEDIFQWCREGNAMQVRVWLDDTEHDMNQG